ncbi:MAG: hypothetical protein IJZ19_11625 [Lentisphaeria bacterium]|nr:hypothetical protein [Lentisphaeria bacterium]
MKKAICVFLSICAAAVSIQPLAAKDTKMLKELKKITQDNTEDEIISYLQKEKISPGKIYTAEGCQFSLLIPMIASGKYKVVRYLVENGADVKFIFKNGKNELTPLGALLCLDFARYNRKNSSYSPNELIKTLYDLARLMIAKGADVKAVTIWDQGERKESIFGLAMYVGAQIRKHDLSFLQLLIDKGADPHGVTNFDRQSHKPHSFYFLANNTEAALFLMDLNVRPTKQNIDKNSLKNRLKNTRTRFNALQISYDFGNFDKVFGQIDTLLEAGVDPNEIDLSETRSMSFAAAEYLCRRGADLNLIGPQATLRADLAAMKAFIEKGLDVESTIVWDKKLRTLLAHNISREEHEICKYLLEKGASVSGDGVEEAVYFLLLGCKRDPKAAVERKIAKMILEAGFSFSDDFKGRNRLDKQTADFFRQNGFAW